MTAFCVGGAMSRIHMTAASWHPEVNECMWCGRCDVANPYDCCIMASRSQWMPWALALQCRQSIWLLHHEIKKPMNASSLGAAMSRTHMTLHHDIQKLLNALGSEAATSRNHVTVASMTSKNRWIIYALALRWRESIWLLHHGIQKPMHCECRESIWLLHHDIQKSMNAVGLGAAMSRIHWLLHRAPRKRKRSVKDVWKVCRSYDCLTK
jgi:hypothetical protein